MKVVLIVETDEELVIYSSEDVQGQINKSPVNVIDYSVGIDEKNVPTLNLSLLLKNYSMIVERKKDGQGTITSL